MKDLFGESKEKDKTKGPINRSAIEAHKNLIGLYGSVEGKTCKSCPHLRKHQFGSTFYKCGKSKQGGMSTDWRVGWQACGLHNIE